VVQQRTDQGHWGADFHCGLLHIRSSGYTLQNA
jgi:hypothetical protein